MKIIAILLCRGNSKGVPRKNIKLLNGKPLLSYVLGEAKKCEFFDGIYVSTDDWEIKYVAENFGAKVIDRPVELATDTAKSLESIKHALNILGADVVVLLSACTPFISSFDISEAIKKYLQTKKPLVSVVEDFSAHPNKVIINGIKSNFETGTRQEMDKVMKRNTAIYISSREYIMKNNALFGDDCEVYEMPKSRSLDLNDSHDFLMAELYMKYLTQ